MNENKCIKVENFKIEPFSLVVSDIETLLLAHSFQKRACVIVILLKNFKISVMELCRSLSLSLSLKDLSCLEHESEVKINWVRV